MVMIWEVEWGTNFSRKLFQAKNISEALDIARKVQKQEKIFEIITKVELIAESEN